MTNTITAPLIEDHVLKQQIITQINIVYPDLSNEFYGWELYNKVRTEIAKTLHKYIYPDTCLRYFRQLREDGVIKCDCKNRSKSLYIKIL